MPERSQKRQQPVNITQSASQPQEQPSDCPPESPRSPRSPHSRRSRPWSGNTQNIQQQTARETLFSPTESLGQLSPGATDRVFPIRSVVSVDPNPTPSARSDKSEGYFHNIARTSERRRSSATSASEIPHNRPIKSSQGGGAASDTKPDNVGHEGRKGPDGTEPSRKNGTTLPRQRLSEVMSGRSESDGASETSDRPLSAEGASSVKNTADEPEGLLTARFKHIITEGGHAVVTGRDGDTLQRCEDEPIHIPGAIQNYGLLIALQEEADGKFVVRIVSENSERMIGYTPQQLFALDSFCDILSEAQTDNLLDHIDFIRDEDADVATNGPEVFTISIRSPKRKSQKLWCAMHINERNPGLIICEFELEDDPINPLIPSSELTPESPEDTLQSKPTPEEFAESTENSSRPLRVLRSARKRKGEAAAMEVFNIMSQVQEQLAVAPNLEKFLKVLVGVVKELTGFHRVMIYQFDKSWNGRVVTELVDPRATKDLYKGLNFPASDIPKQARDLYKINKVRLLYDRDQETARLVCRTLEDLETPLDLTYSYLRAMSPIHIKYLANMAVRSSMSISINAFDELWGLIACHSYGPRGMRVSFPIRKMCRLVGDSASRNIERLSYASRLQARKLINTAPSQENPSGYIVASSEDLLKLFDADFGLLSIRDETKILGQLDQSQEVLAMLEYLRMRKITSVTTSQDITEDFPDLRYPPGFSVIAGLLLVPLSVGGNDFIVLFRKGQLKEVKWAGNPYEKFIKEGTEGYLEPRKSFKKWSEVVVGKCREWTEEEIETAAVLCLVYGKFIEVWRQKEAALQSSQLTRLLLANSAHEVRTPLNAIINYLEIALEGTLDQETRENLAKSHSASKSLIYVINDLLDLTKTEEGGELIKGEVFDLKATLREATDMFTGDAKRKGISYEVVDHPGVPQNVIGDQRKVRQAISNVTANAIQNTINGGVKVEMYVVSRYDEHVDVEIAVQDSGIGMSSGKLDALFRDLEQVQSETTAMLEENLVPNARTLTQGQEEKRTLGLGLAVVARIVRNMNGQLRLKSEEGKGSRFILQFPFDLPDDQTRNKLTDESTQGSTTTQPSNLGQGEVTLVDRDREGRGSGSSFRSMRQRSVDSVNSKRSIGSFKSGNSAISTHSDVDRLIEAIQEPHLVEGRSPGERSMSARSTRPRMHKRVSSSTNNPSTPQRSRARSLDSKSGSSVTPVTPKHLRCMKPSTPGQVSLQDSGSAIKAVKIPDDFSSPPNKPRPSGKIVGEVKDDEGSQPKKQTNIDHMNVLVAEDDPVNSRIIKKRLEKLGHEVYLTVNGEDCASAYGDKAGFFDVVLMDMQMPIVDGLTSTKMIRSFEKTHPTHMLSKRASLNGRIPIIAVSASLVEKDRQTYIDAGFDGWILKPISFPRLSELMAGIVDQSSRKEALYKPGDWEKGGWFNKAEPDIFAADTAPSGRIPTSNPSKSVKIAATVDDPAAGDGGDGDVPEEQRRLLEEQETYRRNHDAETDGDDLDYGSKRKTRSAPELGRTLVDDGDDDDVDDQQIIPQVASPEPMDE